MAQEIKIPAKLPTIAKAIKAFCTWRDEPNPNLMNLTLMNTFGNHSDIDQIWVTGSSAWHPAVYGEPIDRIADIDIIFHDVLTAETWAKMVVDKLNEYTGKTRFKVTMGKNAFGGPKILYGGNGIIDAIGLEPDETIYERLMTFERLHERVAFRADARPDDPSTMIRMMPKTLRKEKEKPVYYGS